MEIVAPKGKVIKSAVALLYLNAMWTTPLKTPDGEKLQMDYKQDVTGVPDKFSCARGMEFWVASWNKSDSKQVDTLRLVVDSKSTLSFYDTGHAGEAAFQYLVVEVEDRLFHITFKNYDGTVLQTVDVAQGKKPEYTGATPTRPATAQYTYTFNGWGGDLKPATKDTTYTHEEKHLLREHWD